MGRGDPELIARVAAHELTISKAERLLPRRARPPRVVADDYTIEAWRALPEEERAALLGLRCVPPLPREEARSDGDGLANAKAQDPDHQ